MPDYLVGEKKDKKWDYISIFRRLLYTLKIYDCYPLLSNNQIPLAYEASEEIEALAKKLIALGYQDINDLVSCTKHKYPKVAVIVEANRKIFRTSGGITIMVCMCSTRRRKPLYISDLLKHFDKIVVNHDFVYHNLLLLKITEDESRFKPQIISLKEAEKIKDDSKIEKLVRIINEVNKSDE